MAARRNGPQVEILFRNTGTRIPPQQLERIFEKFYRLDSARSSRTGGAGLGLAIAKEIVELHGGNIVASSDDQYTCLLYTSRVVVIRAPLQGLCYTVRDAVDWIRRFF